MLSREQVEGAEAGITWVGPGPKDRFGGPARPHVAVLLAAAQLPQRVITPEAGERTEATLILSADREEI